MQRIVSHPPAEHSGSTIGLRRSQFTDLDVARASSFGHVPGLLFMLELDVLSFSSLISSSIFEASVL